MFAAVATLFALVTPSIAMLPGQAEEQGFPFVERFDAEAGKRWHVMTGNWTFGDGFARQSDAAFDCGAALAIKPTGPFWLAVRFRPESTFNGGGLFFALPSVEKKNGGMLVRCDPDGRILWGWFDESGTFNYYNEAIYDDDGDREQELAVAVDPDKNAFNIYITGQRVATNVRTFHTAGFVGLQSSGGPHTFVKFEIRPATPQELDGLKPPGTYSRIVDVIGNDKCVVALRRGTEFLTVYDAQGTPHDVGKGADLRIHLRTWEDVRPVALAWDRPAADGRGILVLGYGGTIIWRIGPDFQVRGGPLLEKGDMKGTALAVDADGRIFVADAAIPGIRVFDAQGQQLATFGEKGPIAAHDRSDPKSAGKFNSPRGIAIAPTGEIVVADRENYTYVVYKFDPATSQFEFVRNGPWMPYPGQVFFDSRGKMLMAGTFEYYRGYGALRVMNLDGLGEKTWLAHSLRDMSDKVRACQGPDGKYYVVDPDKDRFMILPPDFVEQLPEFKWTKDGGVQLTMTKVDGSKAVTTNNERDEDGRVIVRQKEPICETWPPAQPEDLTTYSLPPAPAKGKMYVIDMPILVAVFTKAQDEKGNEITIDPTGVTDRLQRELARARHFYWLNSHATLNVQFDYMLVDEPGAKIDGGWIQPTPARDLVNKARAKQGLPPIDKDHSLIGIHPMGGFDPKDTDEPGFVGGGGLTPYAYSGYALWNHGQAWLMGHEWGHQLDAYFEKSGFPDWWLNHPDGTVHIGRYGEHWDCNAFLCRRADKLNWLRFKFGTLRLVDDQDGDGLPDDDPTLPLDEKRFGSDPTKIDTDGDGLDDLAEMCAGTFTSSDPRKPDTNGNGVPDGKDPYPQFDVYPVLGPANLQGQRGPIGRVHNEWADAVINAWYDADAVHYEVDLKKPAQSVQLPMDWNNDGWFVGQDNFYYSVDLEWPKDGPAKIKAAHDCEAKLVGTSLEVTVKRPPARTPLKPGEYIGICPRLQNGGGTIAFLLDPWQILGLKLE